MESCFQKLLTTVKNDLNAKIGDMQMRIDAKDGIIEDLRGKIKDLKEQTETLYMELQNEKNGQLDDMNALKEVRDSTLKLCL